MSEKIICTPICYKLKKIISILEYISLFLLVLNVILASMNITGSISFALAFLFYALVSFAYGCLLRYTASNLSVEKQYNWFEELKNMCEFIREDKRSDYRSLLVSIRVDGKSAEDSIRDKHVSNLRTESIVKFFISIWIICFIAIPLLLV